MILASFPKLADQWKVIFDFKPTELLGAHFPSCLLVISSSLELGISFPYEQANLWVTDLNAGLNADDVIVDLWSDQLLELDVWSRIEISHVEEGGRYFLSYSVGGKELGRTDFGLGTNLTDVKICIGSDCFSTQPGLLRGLVVLDEQ